MDKFSFKAGVSQPGVKLMDVNTSFLRLETCDFRSHLTIFSYIGGWISSLSFIHNAWVSAVQ